MFRETYFVALLLLGLSGGHDLIPSPPLITNEPYFDSSMEPNITAHVGRNAMLHCRVHNVGNRTQVSWIRRRDLRILTVGRYTYTTDLRYQATHLPGTNQWTLTIRSAQPRDAGHYDCQISSKPIKVFTTHLRVLEPTVELLGAPDLYVQRYSMINLTCVLKGAPEPPVHVHWYHRNKSISFSSSRGGVHLVVEKGPTTTSHLLIRNARLQDSGLYTCAPDNATATSIHVHVLNGEHPAAMQTNAARRAVLPPTLSTLKLLLPALLVQALPARTLTLTRLLTVLLVVQALSACLLPGQCCCWLETT